MTKEELAEGNELVKKIEDLEEHLKTIDSFIEKSNIKPLTGFNLCVRNNNYDLETFSPREDFLDIDVILLNYRNKVVVVLNNTKEKLEQL